MGRLQEIEARRVRRKKRVRRRVVGTREKPRLCVFRSLKHVYAQIVDDEAGNTLIATSTLAPDVRQEVAGKAKLEAAKVVGIRLAKMAVSKNIKHVVFDRGSFSYHGRLKALAEGAREGGLEF